MRIWIWIAVICGATACGQDENPWVGPLDSTTPDPCGQTCNPVAQTGCAAAERCTYLHDGAGGFLGDDDCDPGPVPACVPDATAIPIGEACEVTAEEADDCEPASLCIDGTCRALCGTPTPACAGTCAPVDGVDVCTPAAR